MATVYLAHDLKHDRDVALKVLRSELAESLGRDRFLREIQLAARLSHPHILPLHDSGDAGGALFYVMPNVAGRSLRDRLRGARQLPVDEAVRIAMEVAGALDHAHRHSVIHRDVKPENIVLQDGHALVADFGIGKAVGDAAADTLTQHGMSVGTPAFRSTATTPPRSSSRHSAKSRPSPRNQPRPRSRSSWLRFRRGWLNPPPRLAYR